jgi:selenocysteine-specific elongation factor
MIVGTAGHIDHGKTALVRVLTGTDADRLPEEKRRGITIELGYAFMPGPEGESVGFVDVPGHEKLVCTMVAGVSGIDYALLLIAADDGVMPQTVEHLTILSLLGVQRGAAVVTKIDKADDSLRATRLVEARAMLDAAGLAHFRVLGVSAQTGDGVEDLRALLLQEARSQAPANLDKAGFRMDLDRVFTLSGIGTVVAGSIAAGEVRVGDSLCLANAPAQTYRVRGLHVHGREVLCASAGQRCAVGLVGLERAAVERGQTLCDPVIAQTTSRLDAWLQVAKTEGSPLHSGTLMHLHTGTQDCMATVAALGQQFIAPGESALAQLVMKQPVVAWHGQRFVLRDASASRTMAGGTVLDTAAPARYRQTLERLACLQSQRELEPATRLNSALVHAPWGIHAGQWLRSAGFGAWPFDMATLQDVVFDKGGEWVIGAAQLVANEQRVIDVLGDFHAKFPEDIGPDTKRSRRLAAPRMPEGLWTQLLAHMMKAGKLASRSGFVHLPGHGEQLRAQDKAVAERALPLLLDGKFDPPWVRDIAVATRLPESQLRSVLARLARTGDVYLVVKDLYYHPHAVRQLALLARALAAQGEPIEAAAFRDATGLGRKRAIQLLEFFDRIGFLRRVGDAHLLRPGTSMFAHDASAT